MADFMCVYAEMEALQTKFNTEAGDLNATATQMRQFQNDVVASAIKSFKEKMEQFSGQISQTKNDLETETTRVCGPDGHSGEGWHGVKSQNFVNSVFDTNGGLAGNFNTLLQDIQEINLAFTELETKIGQVIEEMGKNVDTVSGFCTNNADFTNSMEQAAAMLDGTN